MRKNKLIFLIIFPIIFAGCFKYDYIDTHIESKIRESGEKGTIYYKLNDLDFEISLNSTIPNIYIKFFSETKPTKEEAIKLLPEVIINNYEIIKNDDEKIFKEIDKRMDNKEIVERDSYATQDIEKAKKETIYADKNGKKYIIYGYNFRFYLFQKIESKPFVVGDKIKLTLDITVKNNGKIEKEKVSESFVVVREKGLGMVGW